MAWHPSCTTSGCTDVNWLKIPTLKHLTPVPNPNDFKQTWVDAVPIVPPSGWRSRTGKKMWRQTTSFRWVPKMGAAAFGLWVPPPLYEQIKRGHSGGVNEGNDKYSVLSKGKGCSPPAHPIIDPHLSVSVAQPRLRPAEPLQGPRRAAR